MRQIKVNHGLSIYLTMPLNWAGRHRYQKTDYDSFSVVSGIQKTKSLPDTCFVYLYITWSYLWGRRIALSWIQEQFLNLVITY